MKNMNVKGKIVSKANVRIDVVVTWTSSVGSMQTLTNDWQAINNIVVVVIDSALPSLYCANLYSLSIHIVPVTSCHCMCTYLVVGMFPCDGREWHYNCQSRNNECVLLRHIWSLIV